MLVVGCDFFYELHTTEMTLVFNTFVHSNTKLNGVSNKLFVHGYEFPYNFYFYIYIIPCGYNLSIDLISM